MDIFWNCLFQVEHGETARSMQVVIPLVYALVSLPNSELP